MKYFLDTNICIYLLKQDPFSVIKRFLQHEVDDIGVSSIVVSELQYGVEKSQHKARNQSGLDILLAPLTIVSYGHEAARHYGEIRASLERSGQMIGREDALIAAHARSAEVVLVTNNEREFQRVPGLKIENWV